MTNKTIPLVGGFNNGKFVKPKKRHLLKMACPAHCSKCHMGFDYETYKLTSFIVGRKIFWVYVIEGITIETVITKLILGYMQCSKKKILTLSQT